MSSGSPEVGHDSGDDQDKITKADVDKTSITFDIDGNSSDGSSSSSRQSSTYVKVKSNKRKEGHEIDAVLRSLQADRDIVMDGAQVSIFLSIHQLIDWLYRVMINYDYFHDSYIYVRIHAGCSEKLDRFRE